MPEQVAFRADFPGWLSGLGERDRAVAGDLMLGERTTDVAGKYGISPARVSQLREQFHADWVAYCGDVPTS